MQLYRSDLINRGVTVLLLLEKDLPEPRRPRAAAAGAAEPGDQRLRRHGRLAGERKLTIISRSLADTEVEFSVWDIGPGLPPGSLEQVFEPFVTTKADGMGLGLSVCKTIVKSHGGRIWAAGQRRRRRELPRRAAGAGAREGAAAGARAA
jgi:signal transduction histidine kinase